MTRTAIAPRRAIVLVAKPYALTSPTSHDTTTTIAPIAARRSFALNLFQISWIIHASLRLTAAAYLQRGRIAAHESTDHPQARLGPELEIPDPRSTAAILPIDADRVGRRNVRSCRQPAGALGTGDPRPAAPERRRARARRGLRLGPRHRTTHRAPAEWQGHRARRFGVDAVRSPPAIGEVRRPRSIRPGRPRAAAPDRSAGRRHPLDGDLPLGPRSLRPLPPPRCGPPTRRSAGRAVRRQGQRGDARTGPDGHGCRRGAPHVRRPGGNCQATRGRRIRRRRDVAVRRADAVRAWPAVRRIPRDGLPARASGRDDPR